MTVRVLGPLDTGTEESLSPRERAIFSALIVRAGASVSSDELAEAYWGDNPPRTWSQQVKTSVARIRGRLGPEAVLTRGSDYVLGIDNSAIDAFEFERLVSRARKHALHSDHDRAIDAYRRALGLWRGRAFSELADWEPARQEAGRLSEIRRSAEEELLEERLHIGAHREIIAEAEQAVPIEPLREERWAILAVANYRAGRQIEALAAIREARERFADEFGVELSSRLRQLETAMLRQDPTLDALPAPPPANDLCPYRGLVPFGPDDAEDFFGRQDAIEAILSRVHSGSILTIVGPSGSGKSSLVLAGVIPRERESGRRVEILRGGATLVNSLRTALHHFGAPEIVVVDQAEAIFQLDEPEIEATGALFEEALRLGGALVLTLRSDFLDRAIALPHIGPDVARGLYALGPLSEEGLRQAVIEPAARAGLRLEPGLVELIVRDAGDRQTTLPHVSHALLETWIRREGSTLTVDGYEESGGIAGAIGQSAENVYQSMDDADAVVCRALMLRLIQRDAGGRSVRRPAQLAPLLADPQRRRVLERLVATRLLTLDGETILVAHEAIATAWPRLDGWLEEDAEGARLVATVATAADLWNGSGRRDEDLLRGARLQSALDWRDRSEPDLTAVEQGFLDAAAERERGEVRELADRAARDKRNNRRLRWALAGAAVLLVVALAAGGLAAVQGGEAQVAAENARVEAVVATSLSLIDNDREMASLLAAEAFRRWPHDPRTRSALWGVMISTGGLVAAHHDPDAYLPVLDIIPGTSTALRVESSEPGRPPKVDIVDINTGQVVRAFDLVLPEVPPNTWYELAVSPDGSAAAIQSPVPDPSDADGCCRRMLTLLDIATGDTLPGTSLVRAQMAGHMAFDGEGGRLYVAQPITGDVMAVDMTTGEVRESAAGVFDEPGDHPGDSGFGIALIDGGLLAVAAVDQIRIFDRETLALARTIPLEGDFTSGDIVADHEGGLVSTGLGGTVRIDVATGATLWRRLVKGEAHCGVLHIASGSTVACGSFLGLALLDLATGETTNTRTALQLNRSPYLATIDDESILVSIETPPIWMRWRIDGGGAGAGIIAKGRELIDGPEQGGSLVVTRARDGGRMRLWDFERDVPVGDESDRIVLLGSGIAARYDGSGRPQLERITTEEKIALRITGLPDEFDVMAGAWGRPAFAVWDTGIVAFDPATGEPLGDRLAIAADHFVVWSLSETHDGRRAVLTYETEGRTETALFDIASGAKLVGGLYGLEASHVVNDHLVVGVSDSQAQLYDIATLNPVSPLPRAIGGGQKISVSADGRTLLNVGWNNALTLYDLTADIALASPLRSELSSLEFSGGVNVGFRVGGFLSADGGTLLERVSDGIRVWDLRPNEQALSACALAGRELTEKEWSTYFPGEEQIDTCAELAS
ncbi:BTAD domain-containing putative transcriptional regulator [Microbacterium deminutum]